MHALLAGDSRRRKLFTEAISFFLAFNSITAFQYKVGDLDSWGVPPPSLPNLYASWANNHHFQIGDSLLFLYPPSQDSVVQVTERDFNACSVADPVLKMKDGNSVFNFTTPGTFYFISGISGHCEKRQKLRVAVPDANGTFFPQSDAPAIEPPAYPLMFGPTPAGGSASPVRSLGSADGRFAAAAALLFCIF